MRTPRAHRRASKRCSQIPGRALNCIQYCIAIRGLVKADGVRYRQMLHDTHHVAVSIQGTTFYAAFTPDLVLESITGHDHVRVWPPYPTNMESEHV